MAEVQTFESNIEMNFEDDVAQRKLRGRAENPK